MGRWGEGSTQHLRHVAGWRSGALGEGQQAALATRGMLAQWGAGGRGAGSTCDTWQVGTVGRWGEGHLYQPLLIGWSASDQALISLR